jgi:heme/copper-type cytochrome/quinol oxidase subunit 1
VPDYAPFHQASTIGVIILDVGIALMVYYLVASLFQGKKAMQNQWGGVTLDWLSPTPPAARELRRAAEGRARGLRLLDARLPVDAHAGR